MAAVKRAPILRVVELLTIMLEPTFVELTQRMASGTSDFSHIILATELRQA